MTDPMSCSRCGRDRTSADTVAVDPADPAQADEAVATWAWIGGEDVCPACQTHAERRQVGERIADAIRGFVQQQDAADVPPEAVEVPMIEYAMRVRESVGAGASTAGPAPQGRAAPSDTPPAVTFRVAVTGAFLTGQGLAVQLQRYDDLQHRLLGALGSSWVRGDRTRSPGGTYQSGGGFTRPVPLVVARRMGVDLLGSVAHPVSGGLRPVLREVTPRAVCVDVYDLGVAVLTADLDVVAGSADYRAIARAVRELTLLQPEVGDPPPLARRLQEIATETARQYAAGAAAAAPDELRDGAWRSADRSRGDRSSLVPVEDRGRLLWLHPVHVMPAPGDAEAAEEVAARLAPPFEVKVCLDGGGVLAAGIGWSAIAVPDRAEGRPFHYRPVEDTPLRLTRLHWAYYALYMEIDRVLLGVLDAQRWRGKATLGQLEADADDIAADHLRLMNVRARLDSRLGSLGGDELKIWATIAEVQGFEALREGVERKVDVLDKLAQRRVGQATQERERRTTTILGTLTVLTVVALAGGLIGVFLSSPSTEGSVWIRIGVVGASLAVACLLYWLAYARTARAPVPYGGTGSRR